jgi:hypothetical protein
MIKVKEGDVICDAYNIHAKKLENKSFIFDYLLLILSPCSISPLMKFLNKYLLPLS